LRSSRSWALNVCLSTSPFTKEVLFEAADVYSAIKDKTVIGKSILRFFVFEIIFVFIRKHERCWPVSDHERLTTFFHEKGI